MKRFLATMLLLSAIASGVAQSTGEGGVFDPAVTEKATTKGSSTNAPGSSLFPTPVVVITPGIMDFGGVLTNTYATNTFLVENAGRGKVVGKASVSPPFKITDGANYSLSRKEKQVVTIVYGPRILTGSNDVRNVTFTGAGTAKALVTGTPLQKRLEPSR